MKPAQRVFVVGGGHSTLWGRARPEFIHRKHPDFGSKKIRQSNLTSVLHSTKPYGTTGIDPSCVDKVYVSNFFG